MEADSPYWYVSFLVYLASSKQPIPIQPFPDQPIKCVVILLSSIE